MIVDLIHVSNRYELEDYYINNNLTSIEQRIDRLIDFLNIDIADDKELIYTELNLKSLESYTLTTLRYR